MRGATFLGGLASPRLTVLFFLLMAGAALAASRGAENITAVVVGPLALLIANLGAAIVTNRRFRADLPLLVFHLALLALVTLLVIARLIYFDGAVRLTVGNAFAGHFDTEERGSLHRGTPHRLRFSHEGLIEDTPAGGYPTTFANIRWLDAAGRIQSAVIGNDRPLYLDGYRIFASRERGYSPLFRWQAPDGQEHFGTAQMQDSFSETGRRDFPAGTMLELPGGPQAWVQIVPVDGEAARGPQLNLGSEVLPHQVVVRAGEIRHELLPGASIDLAGGRLTYLRLSTWMGYRVTYDPTAPWLVATVIVGLLSLAAFYARLWRRPQHPLGVAELAP